MLLSGAGAAVLLLLLNYVVLEPYLDASELLDQQTRAATQELEAGQLVLVREQSIRGAWAAHAAAAPKATPEDLEAAFQADLVKLFADVKIQSQGFEKRRETKHGDSVEIIFTSSFTGSNKDLVRLMRALDEYPGYLRANLMQVNTKKDKQDQDMDVKLEISTIWFSSGNGGKS